MFKSCYLTCGVEGKFNMHYMKNHLWGTPPLCISLSVLPLICYTSIGNYKPNDLSHNYGRKKDQRTLLDIAPCNYKSREINGEQVVSYSRLCPGANSKTTSIYNLPVHERCNRGGILPLIHEPVVDYHREWTPRKDPTSTPSFNTCFTS